MNNKIHSLKLGYSNAFCIEGTGGLSLIDTGLKNNSKKIEKLLGQLGFKLRDIKRILITHAHPDHIGSLAELIEATNASLWVHGIEASIMRGDSLMQNAATAELPPIDRILQAIAPKPEKLDFKVDRG